MKTELVSASNVGLRHVIEDGLAILSNHQLSDERRTFVLADLADLLGQASRGAQLASSASFFVGGDDRVAFDAFSLLDKLNSEANELDKENLRASAAAFNALRTGNEVAMAEKRRAAVFLKKLLGSLERESSSELVLDFEPSLDFQVSKKLA
jgi:hypothetical protein